MFCVKKCFYISYRYTPSQQGLAFNSGAKQRVIRMVEMQKDPMEPPRFKYVAFIHDFKVSVIYEGNSMFFCFLTESIRKFLVDLLPLLLQSCTLQAERWESCFLQISIPDTDSHQLCLHSKSIQASLKVFLRISQQTSKHHCVSFFVVCWFFF